MSSMLKLKVSNSCLSVEIAEGHYLKSMADLVSRRTGVFCFFGWLAGTNLAFLRVSSRKREVDINGNVVIAG